MKKKPIIYQFTDIWRDTPITAGLLVSRWFVFLSIFMIVQLISAVLLYPDRPFFVAWGETITAVTLIVGFLFALIMTYVTHPVVFLPRTRRIEIDLGRVRIRSKGPFFSVSLFEADRVDTEVIHYPAMRSGVKDRTYASIGILSPTWERVYHLDPGEANLLLGEFRKKGYAIVRAAERPFIYHDIHRDERKILFILGAMIILTATLLAFA